MNPISPFDIARDIAVSFPYVETSLASRGVLGYDTTYDTSVRTGRTEQQRSQRAQGGA